MLPHDYPDLNLASADIVNLEATDRILPSMPAGLQTKAQDKLRELGVEIRLRAPVASADEGGVTLRSGERVPVAPWCGYLECRQRFWLRLYRPPRSQWSPGCHRDPAVAGPPGGVHHRGHGPRGRARPRPHPMVAPVAIQQGDLVAKNIFRQMAGEPPKPFSYKDRGTMVTIGRQAAVAQIYGLKLTGFIAWVIWLTVHLVWLIGFRNRMLVLINWAWNYLTYERAVRLIRNRR